MTVWLQGLIAAVMRPIIREEINQLKGFIVTQWRRKEAFEEYDKEAQELMEQMANASTSEERWAILARIKKSRPSEFM